MNNKKLKEKLKLQKADRERPLRVVEYIEYPFILDGSNVELQESYILSDKETYDVFASFIFKNIGKLPVKKLNIRLSCYQYQNIPYTNIDFTYSADDLTFGIISKRNRELKLNECNKRTEIYQGECFGSCVLIPMPETYFKKMEVYIRSIEYSNGTVDTLNIKVAGNTKRYNDLDNISKMVYTRVNIYVAAESAFPTKVIPQFSNTGWLCCCGNKNAADSQNCESCGREKSWQESSVTATALEETKQKLISDPNERTLHDKTNYAQNKYLEDDKQIQEKIQQYEKAIENVALAEKKRERRKLMVLPKLALWIGTVYLIARILNWLINKV